MQFFTSKSLTSTKVNHTRKGVQSHRIHDKIKNENEGAKSVTRKAAKRAHNHWMWQSLPTALAYASPICARTSEASFLASDST